MYRSQNDAFIIIIIVILSVNGFRAEGVLRSLHALHRFPVANRVSNLYSVLHVFRFYHNRFPERNRKNYRQIAKTNKKTGKNVVDTYDDKSMISRSGHESKIIISKHLKFVYLFFRLTNELFHYKIITNNFQALC